MNELRKLLALIFVVSIAVGVSVLVLIHGWGMSPKSWWWIIGGGVFAQAILSRVVTAIIKD